MSNYILTSDGHFYSSDELYHHGIKGMKWGVRRYQNPDGSLTAAGKKRLSKKSGEYLYTKYENRMRKDTKKRQRVENEYYDALARLVKKHGLEPEAAGDSLYSIGESIGDHDAPKKLCKSFLDKYAAATLDDLKIEKSKEAMTYVKNIFSPDLERLLFKD